MRTRRSIKMMLLLSVSLCAPLSAQTDAGSFTGTWYMYDGGYRNTITITHTTAKGFDFAFAGEVERMFDVNMGAMNEKALLAGKGRAISKMAKDEYAEARALEFVLSGNLLKVEIISGTLADFGFGMGVIISGDSTKIKPVRVPITLNDADYLQMVKASPEYAAAEKRLNAAWKKLKAATTTEQMKSELEEQQLWLKKLRSRDVNALLYQFDINPADASIPQSVIKNGKIDIALAYAYVTNERTKEIEVIINNYN